VLRQLRIRNCGWDNFRRENQRNIFWYLNIFLCLCWCFFNFNKSKH